MNKGILCTISMFSVLAVPISIVEAGQCREFIETLSAATLATEYNTTENWIVANHKSNLWQNNNEQGKGNVVGKLLPGSRALILDRAVDCYKVLSPYDKSTGWISNSQISHTLFQDTKTFEPCIP